MVLMEPKWNVKQVYAVVSCYHSCRINGTKVECKEHLGSIKMLQHSCINGTKVECKEIS